MILAVFILILLALGYICLRMPTREDRLFEIVLARKLRLSAYDGVTQSGAVDDAAAILIVRDSMATARALDDAINLHDMEDSDSEIG